MPFNAASAGKVPVGGSDAAHTYDVCDESLQSLPKKGETVIPCLTKICKSFPNGQKDYVCSGCNEMCQPSLTRGVRFNSRENRKQCIEWCGNTFQQYNSWHKPECKVNALDCVVNRSVH